MLASVRGQALFAGDSQSWLPWGDLAETVSVVADPSPPVRVALPDQLVLGKERYGR